jgi:pre-mRNA-splicing factor CWC26
MPLADYLAQNYLSADSKPSKKRKRKEAKAEGISIADDGANDWTNGADKNSDDEDAPTISGGTTLAGGLNKPAKKWVTIGSAAPKDSDQAAADAILADAQAESNARDQEDDEEWCHGWVAERGSSDGGAEEKGEGGAQNNARRRTGSYRKSARNYLP